MKITNAKCSSLQFRCNVATGLIILGKPSKVGRPLCPPPPSAPVKRRKSNYSVAPAIRLENRSVHWPIFGEKKGKCEVCSKKGLEKRLYSKCSTCNTFLCIQKGKNCFAEYHELH